MTLNQLFELQDKLDNYLIMRGIITESSILPKKVEQIIKPKTMNMANTIDLSKILNQKTINH